MATAVPILIVPSFWFIMPESIHWLVAAKKPEKALQMLHKVAKYNRKKLPAKFDEEFNDAYENVSSQQKANQVRVDTLAGLFRTPRLRKNMFILFFKS